VQQKNSTKTKGLQLFVCVEITGTKATTLKSVLGISLGEDGFRDIFFIQQYVLNDQAYDKPSGNKDYYEMYVCQISPQ
jgi:hypothetical protein